MILSPRFLDYVEEVIFGEVCVGEVREGRVYNSYFPIFSAPHSVDL